MFAAGFADRYHSSNCGWVALEHETLLVDLPRGMVVAEFLKLVAATTGKPALTLVLTHYRDGDSAMVASLRERGIRRVITSPAVRTKLVAAAGGLDPQAVQAVGDRTAIGLAATAMAVEFLPMDEVAGQAAGAVHLSGTAGPFCRTAGRSRPARAAERHTHRALGRCAAKPGEARAGPGGSGDRHVGRCGRCSRGSGGS